MRPTPRHSRGLTLIEVMVAIAIFAVLGVLSYRAVSSMITSRDRMEAEYARWRQISRVMQLIDNDLAQLAPRPPSGVTQSAGTLVLMRGGEREQLNLVRHDGGNGGIEQHAWHVEDGTLILSRQGANTTDAPTRDDAMLDQVKTLTWEFMLADGTLVNAWPPGPNQSNQLPVAVKMTLELDDAGKITRTFAIH